MHIARDMWRNRN